MNIEQKKLVDRLLERDISLRRFLKIGREGDSDNKAAFEAEWHNRLYIPGELEGWERWGVCGRDELVLIDTDNAEMANIIRRILPPTFEVTTPRRKLPHFYFHVTDGEVPNRVLHLVDDTKGAGEIRAQNQYLVAPGTEIAYKDLVTGDVKHGMYEVLKDIPIAQLKYDDFIDRVTPYLGVDSKQSLTRQHMQEGVESGTRHAYGIRYATLLVGNLGLDDSGALQAMIEWNKKNRPPMNERDLERMVRNARGIVGEPTPPPPGAVELGGKNINGDEKGKLTDKFVTDTILAENDYYCDRLDPNMVLYVWKDGMWHNGVAEGVILSGLRNIFVDEESRQKLSPEKVVNYVKGDAMQRVLAEPPPELINFKNGILNIHKMTLEPHEKSLFFVNQIPHDFAPFAKCPKWEKFVSEVIPKKDIPFFQEWFGYAFYRDVPEAAFAIFTGVGANGKTIAMKVFVEMLGRKNNTDISLGDLVYSDFAPAQLYQKLANICDDLGSTVIKRTGTLKKVSAGSGINAHKKYGKLFDFEPYSKITYACNEPPEIKDMSDAIRNRLKFVEFPYVFTKNPTGDEKLARDRKELLAELYAEIPGIVNWAFVGLKRFLEKNANFSSSKTTKETWKMYARKSTPVLSFMEECIRVTDDIDDNLTSEEMYQTFTSWLKVNRIKLKVSRQKMMTDLKDEGLTTSSHREVDRKMRYYGVLVSSRQGLSFSVSPEREERNKKEEREREQKRLDGLTDPTDHREALHKHYGINPFKRAHALELFPEDQRDQVSKVIDRCIDQGELMVMETDQGREALKFIHRG